MQQAQLGPSCLSQAAAEASAGIELRHLRYFVALADAAVPTGPSVLAGTQPGLIRLPLSTGIHDMVRVSIQNHPLTATASPVWSGDLPRPLQQILFESADGVTSPAPARRAELVSVSTLPPAGHF
jgi:hypothetical protein